ncbi:hypothetical protein [Gluconobacter cerinus]|uniref:Uncharacterized protein n=1 Tax=Gluconobacter cerinus TaxID=38307 RepID=A0A1B6VKC9_9PROT|nr:hypothetical protein [Gluconobacter cerinus]OAJ67437.1 hypothetical protein A0123_02036 [Gluconobacter cerinus]
MSKLSRRTQKAEERLAALAAKYEAEGLDAEAAREKARLEMADNARGDWRAG